MCFCWFDTGIRELINMVSIRLKNEVYKVNDKELPDLLKKETHGSPNWQFIYDEILLRKIRKTDNTSWWQLTINFILILCALAAIFAVYLAWSEVMPL